jgi:hypothetical protein
MSSTPSKPEASKLISGAFKMTVIALGTTRIPFVIPLFFLAWFSGTLLEPGDLGSSDVAYRLQATHSLWTGEPQVRPEDRNWTLPLGRDGLRRIPWGIGQSLVMLPADIVVSAVVSFLALPETIVDKVREALVGYLSFPLISAAAAVLAVLVLRRLGFSDGQSAAGGITLFFCTSLFPYTQVHQENSCLILLDLISIYGVLSWLRTGASFYLTIVGAALGLSILMRLTSVFDLAAIIAFTLLVFRDENYRLRGIMVAFGKYVAPFLTIAFVIDRIYQFERFGTWTDTYLNRFAYQVVALNPGLPQNWPWTYPFWDGIYLILISPERSIFLFDPLLLITLWISLRHWNKVSWSVRNFLIMALLLLGADLAFYACHDTPVGASTWGSRFTTTPVILLSMLAVPLVLQIRALLSRFEMALAMIVISLATAVQLLAVLWWYQLEEAQMYDTGSGFVIGMRLVNTFAIILDKFQDWHLATPSVTPRYLKLNFVPFLMEKYISVGVAYKLKLVWSAAVVLALAAGVRLTVRCFRFERCPRVPKAISL